MSLMFEDFEDDSVLQSIYAKLWDLQLQVHMSLPLWQSRAPQIWVRLCPVRNFHYFLKEVFLIDVVCKGFSMTRFVRRTIAICIHMRRLMRLAFSPKFAPFWAEVPTIKCCTSATQTVRVDGPKAVKNLSQMGDASGDILMPHPKLPVTTYKAQPHAELKVFAILIQEALNSRIPYWAIGTSKLMCLGC